MEAQKERSTVPADRQPQQHKNLRRPRAGMTKENEFDVRAFLLLVTADKLLAYRQIVVS